MHIHFDLILDWFNHIKLLVFFYLFNLVCMTCCYAKAYLKCKYSRNEHSQLIFKIDQYIKKNNIIQYT